MAEDMTTGDCQMEAHGARAEWQTIEINDPEDGQVTWLIESEQESLFFCKVTYKGGAASVRVYILEDCLRMIPVSYIIQQEFYGLDKGQRMP